LEYNLSNNKCLYNFTCHRNEESQRATWKLNDLAELSEDGSQGCIRAKFELKSGPSKPSTSAISFISEGASLSGVDFELVGNGYRISLLKKRFGAGKSLKWSLFLRTFLFHS